MKTLLTGLALLVGLAFPSADSAFCRMVGHCDLDGPTIGVDVEGDLACVAARESGMYVVDISDPTNPVEVGHWRHSQNCYSVDIDGDSAYLASDYGLRIIDISDPANPTQVRSYHTPCSAIGVTKVGDYVHVCTWTAGLCVYDISDSLNLSYVGRCETDSARTVAITGGYAYVADQGDMQVIDIHDPSSPFRLGSVPSHSYDEGVHEFGLHYICMADGTTLRFVDVRDPDSPVEVSHYDQAGWAFDVDIVGRYAYVAVSRNGLCVMDVSDPSDPIQVGHYDPQLGAGASWQTVKKQGNYEYVADYHSGLHVLEFYGEQVGIEDGRRPSAGSSRSTATIVRGVLFVPDDRKPATASQASLLDAAGRMVMELQPGPNDVRHLRSGIYFISSSKSVERLVLTR